MESRRGLPSPSLFLSTFLSRNRKWWEKKGKRRRGRNYRCRHTPVCVYVSVCVCVEDGTVMVWKPSAWPSLGPSPPACSRFCLVSPVSPSVDPSFFHFLCLFLLSAIYEYLQLHCTSLHLLPGGFAIPFHSLSLAPFFCLPACSTSFHFLFQPSHQPAVSRSMAKVEVQIRSCFCCGLSVATIFIALYTLVS